MRRPAGYRLEAHSRLRSGEFERCFPGNLTVVPGILDMVYFDASFVAVDEAEISPPSFTQYLAVGVCFRPKSIPATFARESNN
jgi:hypothetical protein